MRTYAHDAVPLGVISVIRDGKALRSFLVSSHLRSAWEDFSTAFGIAGKTAEGFEVIHVPEANARWKKEKPLSCLFEATKGVVQTCLGITLDLDDREWFDEHPLTSRDGVAYPDTVRVVQELIDPYHLRVSRIRIMPGMSLQGDLIQWMDILGMNPIAMGDGSTTNDEFAQMTQQDPAKVAALYRMEYSSEPVRPGILCAASSFGSMNTSGVNLGHAEYLGVRGKLRAKEPILQIQIGREAEVAWDKVPVFPPANDAPNAMTFDYWGTIGPDNMSMQGWYSRHPRPWGKNPQLPAPTQELAGGGGGRARSGPMIYSSTTTGTVECYVCGDKKSPVATRYGANCCQRCWDGMWKQWDCFSCSASLVGSRLRHMAQIKKTTVEAEALSVPWMFRVDCVACKEVNEVEAAPRTHAYKVLNAVRGIRTVA